MVPLPSNSSAFTLKLMSQFSTSTLAPRSTSTAVWLLVSVQPRIVAVPGEERRCG